MRRALLIIAVALAGCGSTVAPRRHPEPPPEPAAKKAPPKSLDPRPDLPLQWTPGTPDWAQ